MRFPLLLSLCLLSAFSIPAVAKTVAAPTAPALKKSPRMPADKSPYKIASFLCKGDDGQAGAMGLVHLGIDIKDNTVGFFGATLYARLSKGVLATKVLNGNYSTVPGGFVLQASWPGAPGDQIVINLHPNDLTVIPGVPGRLHCGIDAQMEQQ